MNKQDKLYFAQALTGMISLYTVVIVLFYYDWIFDLEYLVSTFTFEASLNVSLCAAAAATVFAMKKRLAEATVANLAALAYFAAFVLFIASNALQSAALLYAGAACAGAGAGALVPAWFALIGQLSKPHYGYILGCMSLCCSVSALAINALPFTGMIISCAALLGASLILYAKLQSSVGTTAHNEPQHSPAQEPTATDEKNAPARAQADAANSNAGNQANASAVPAQKETDDAWRALILPLIYVFFLSFVYGALDEVASITLPVPQAHAGVIYQIGGAVSDIAFLLYVRFGKHNYSTLLNAVLGVIATGLVFLPFFPATFSFALLLLTHTGWALALLISYALVIELFHGKKHTLLAAAAIVFAFPRPGVVGGSWATSSIAVDGQFAFMQSTMLAFALLYVIMMAALFIRTREKRAADKEIRRRDELIKRYARAREDMFKLVCDDLAQEHSLTKRESQLLYFFAQGRDSSFAERELYLSKNTIKSYTKTLYAKLDVHSRQELIDFVKASFPEES